MTPQHPTPTSAPSPTGTPTRHPRLPNTEKRDLADQKSADRLGPIESSLRRPGLPNTEKQDPADQKAADRLHPGLPNTEKRDLADQKTAERRRPGLPNTEKRDLVDQKAADRLERIESFLRRRQALFATQGSVVATWRTYRNRRLGPYFQIVYRQAGRQRALYIGRSEELADRLRRLLDQFQGAHRQRRLFKRPRPRPGRPTAAPRPN